MGFYNNHTLLEKISQVPKKTYTSFFNLKISQQEQKNTHSRVLAWLCDEIKSLPGSKESGR